MYQPVTSKQSTQSRFLSDIVNRVFDGSASNLVLQALGDNPRTSRKELAEIRNLLNKLERQNS